MKKQLLFLMTAVLSMMLFAPLSSSADPVDVSITITPQNQSLFIQPSGGTFDFFVEASNNNSNSTRFQIWTWAILPDNSQIEPLYKPEGFLLPAGWSVSSRKSQYVPAYAPPGIYSLSVTIGLYPDTSFAEDSIIFEKLAASTPWFEQISGTTEYIAAIHFVDADKGWIAGARNTILHTVDGGDNWYKQNPAPSTNYYDIYFVDPKHGWAVGTGGDIVHTEDGGTHWNKQDSSTSYTIYGVFFLDASTGWIVGGKEYSFLPPRRFIHHTTDGGLTWAIQLFDSDKTPFHDIFFIDANTGWAVGDSGAVVYTTDGGISWDETQSGVPYGLRSVIFTDALHGFAVGRESLLSSSDGGMTWVSYPIASTVTLTSVDFSDAMNGWTVGGRTDNTSVILNTADGGATWNEQTSAVPESLSGVSFYDNVTGWATAYSGSIIKTITGGE